MDPIRAARTAAAGTPPVSAHARARMQQRGIRSDALEALLAFGSARHLHGKGRELVFLGSDGTVVTVGHRFRRVRKDR
jgi:hypothetical protein